MGTEIDDLVSRFVEKLRADGSPVQPVAGAPRRLFLEYRGELLTIVLPEGELASLLAEGPGLARDLWGAKISASEAAARLMTVHLQESLETAPDGVVAGTWTYDGAFFTRT